MSMELTELKDGRAGPAAPDRAKESAQDWNETREDRRLYQDRREPRSGLRKGGRY